MTDLKREELADLMAEIDDTSDKDDKKKERQVLHDINNEGQAQKRKAIVYSGHPDTEAADIAKIARWIRTDGGREPDV